MGYQQSLVKFNSEENLKKELIKYFEEVGNKSDALILQVVKCIKELKELDCCLGDLLVVIGGERYTQRSLDSLEEYMGLQNVEGIFFIDGELIYTLSNGEIGKFLDSHFEILEEKEVDILLCK